MVPILGGLVWRRGTNVGAIGNEPIYWVLASGLVVYVIGSLVTKPTDPEVLAEWDRRSRERDIETVPSPVS